MAALVAADVTYTINVPQLKTESGRRKNIVKLVFGDGAKTYPTGGVPLVAADLGMPNVVERMEIMDDGKSAYKITPDLTNLKLVLSAASGVGSVFAEVANTTTPAAQTLLVSVEGW